MTPHRLKLLDELLGEYRAEHAPMWIRPHVSTIRRHVRQTAAVEIADTDPADLLAGYDEAGR